MKYIRTVRSGKEELYDLRLDPHETQSRTELDTEKLKTGRALLAERQKRNRQLQILHGLEEAKPLLNEENLELLKALGYAR